MKKSSKILLLILACVFLFSTGVSASSYSASETLSENQSTSIYKKEKCKNLSYTITVTLSDSAQALARTNELVYNFQGALYCATSRTFERTIDIVCLDENGNEIRGGAYHINEENYIVSGTTYHYESTNTTIPGGTAKIKIYIENSIGTSQTMSIDASFALVSTRNNDSYINKDPEAKESFDMKEYYASGDTVGEGMTLHFYDIFSGSDQSVSLSNSTTLYRNALINQNNFYYWSQFAYDLIKASGTYRDAKGGGFDSDFGATNSNSTPGYYNDLVADFIYTSSEVVDAQEVYGNSSGLKHGSSMKEIFNEFTDNLAMQRNTLLRTNDPSPLQGSDYRDHHALTKDGTSDGEALTTSGGDIFYTYVANTDRDDTAKYDYNGFLLLFYDFDMAAICDDTVYEVTPTYDDPEVKKTVTSNTNKANVTTGVSNTWTYSDSFTNTIGSSNTTTKSMTHGWDVSIGGKIPVVGINIDGGVSGNYTTSEAYTFSDSKATSETYTQSSGESVSVTLPYYTVGELVSTTTKGTATTEYACPIEITYKVAVVAVNGRFYDDGTVITDWYDAETKVWILGDSNGDAVGDLRERGLKDSLGTSDNIPWGDIKVQPAPCSTANYDLKSGNDLLDYLGTNYPVTYDQAISSYSSTYTDYKVNVYASEPLYRTAVTQINSVILSRNDQLYTTPGNYYDISSNITVDGFNAEGAEYYGFAMTDGSWTLEYFNGTPVPENVAKLEKNTSTNKTYLYIDPDYAKNNASTLPILLIYNIGKDVYKSYGAEDYVNNEDLAIRAALTIVVTEPQSIVTESSVIFTDVPKTSYYHNAISYTNHFKYMIGTSSTSFEPQSPITRGQFVTVLYRHSEETAQGRHGFSDIAADSYYEEAISWAAQNGIIKGISETIFAPDDPITREQMAVILYRYAQHKGFSSKTVNDLTKFTDHEAISSYATEALAWANAKKIILGVGNNTIAPQSTATRGQAATVIHRFCQNITN